MCMIPSQPSLYSRMVKTHPSPKLDDSVVSIWSPGEVLGNLHRAGPKVVISYAHRTKLELKIWA